MRVLPALLLMLACPLMAANVAVNLSGTSGPSFATQLQTGDVQVGRFVLQATGGDVTINSITIHFTNAANADEAFTSVRLFYDDDGNGIFATNEEVGTAQVPNGTDDFVTFTQTIVADDTQINELQVRVTVGNNVAAYGQAFRFRIDTAASLNLPNPDTVSGSLPAQANTITIRHSENRLQPGTGNPTGPRTFYFGETNVNALHFLVDSMFPTAPGQLAGINLSAITISITLATALQTPAITRLTLWQDDGDSAFEPGSGEVLVLARTPADVGKWGISGSVISVVFDGTAVQNIADIPTGQARAFWIGLDFDSDGPSATCEISVNNTAVLGAEGAAADFFIGTPALISGNVITLQAKPPKEKSREAGGEGGCSTHGTETQFWLGLVCFAAIWTVSRRVIRTHKG